MWLYAREEKITFKREPNFEARNREKKVGKKGIGGDDREDQEGFTTQEAHGHGGQLI